jgi:hypothetical protein
MREPTATPLVWISDRQAVNPTSILWLFRGTHGELEITFVGGKQIALQDRDLSSEGRALLLPAHEHHERDTTYQAPLQFPR